jgi:hypothetical protein
VICSTEIADQILAHVAENYFPNYAMIVFVGDVRVVRGEKFGAALISKVR